MPYKFFAFISYRHTDMKAAKRLQFLLESYSLPAKLQKNNPDLPKKFKIFRDRDELTAGELDEIIQQNLRDSKYLVVICSPESAQSKYVGDEIAYFRSLGKEKQIIRFIISGVPHSPTQECFHPELKRCGTDYLDVDVQTEELPFKFLRFHKAFVRLVAAMLGLNFSELWSRRKHFLAKLMALLAAIVILVAVLGFTAFKAQPFNASVRLQNPYAELPLSVTQTDSIQLYLSAKDKRVQQVVALDSPIGFPNIPGKYKGQKVRICCKAYGFQPMDTMVVLEERVNLNFHRNPVTYGRIRYQVADNATDAPLSNVVFDFGCIKASTDEAGILDVQIPLAQQREIYGVKITYQGQPMHLTYSEQGDSLRAMDAEVLSTIYIQW